MDRHYLGYSNYKSLKEDKEFENYFNKYVWWVILSKTYENYKKFEADYAKNIELLNVYHPKKSVKGKVDLRVKELTVKYQGQRNTCSVFAATALIEYLIYSKYKKTVDLSEAYNYWAAKKLALTSEYLRNMYSTIDGLAGYLAVEAYKYGSMYEKDWKYENENWLTKKDKRCKTVNNNHVTECFTGTPPENSKKAEYTANPIFIKKKDIGQFILQEKKPVAINIFWYYSAVDKQGNIRLPNDKIDKKGGHVILLVGYDFDTKTFIFKNGWGTKWGNKGYGTITEDYILKYYEVIDYMPYNNDVIKEEKRMIIKSALGVSAILK